MILFSFARFLRFDELSSLRFNSVIVIKDLLAIFIRKSKTGQYCQGNEMLISKGNAVVPLSVKYVPKVSGSSGRCGGETCVHIQTNFRVKGHL